MGIIHILDSELSNKIAAGEVVERPQSVIKELVENSIDAKSTRITVEIKNGGATFMRVTDNGIGMSPDDARLCFLRHATSKIQTDNDLNAIYTLGFRGEAMSSIGAVAKVSLSTKRREDTEGILVTCMGGEILSSADAGVPDGTSIIVEDIFYNTPARLKFLKKDTTEAGYITDIMTKFILAHPEISFKLIINGKEKLFSSGDNSLLNAVYTVYGKDYAQHMKEVSYEFEGIKVIGLAGTGNVSRPNRNYQSYFVNQRYIKSPLIIRAVEEAYKNQVMIGKFPVAVLNLVINPELVDINVHPTKLEVKFSNEKDIYHCVYYGIKNAIYQEANVPEIERESVFKKDTPKEQLYIGDMVKNLPRDKASGFQKKHDTPVSQLTRRPETPNYNPKQNPFLVSKKTDNTVEDKAVNAYKPPVKGNFVSEPKKEYTPLITPDIPNTPVAPAVSDIEEAQPQIKEPEAIKQTPKDTRTENVFIDEYFEIVGQVFDTYIIAQKGDKMLIVDQHAAHERLKFEELKKDLENKSVFSQMLIEPVVITMTGEEYSAFESIAETLSQMGFECDNFGDNTVLVRAVPGEVELGEVEDLVLELIQNAQKKEVITEKQQRLLYTIACKSAIKANHKMSEDEMKTLLKNVLSLQNINTCPHGRPIVITMSKKELEKEFGRIV